MKKSTTEFLYVKDFTIYPGGRYISQGKNSGEEYRKTVLEPALKEYDQIVVQLDKGVIGYSTIFLEEAFGGLIRSMGSEVYNRVSIHSEEFKTREERARKLFKEAYEKELKSLNDKERKQ